jgi:DNA repair protein RecO (recombination protein O)
MSKLYQTTGIVLSWRNYREADRWYSALSREHGKVEFRARGANKHLAKLTPHLETVSVANLLLVNGRYYETVAGVERKRAFPGVYNDLSSRMLAKNALHMVDIGTRAFQKNATLYDALLDWLTFLDDAPSVSSVRAGYLLGGFTLRLMGMVGYRPVLEHCLDCKNNVDPGSFRWHALQGGVVCRACVEGDERQWFNAHSMSDDGLKLLRFAANQPFDDLLKPRLPADTLSEYHEAIESLIVSHFPTIPANSLREASVVA